MGEAPPGLLGRALVHGDAVGRGGGKGQATVGIGRRAERPEGCIQARQEVGGSEGGRCAAIDTQGSGREVDIHPALDDAGGVGDRQGGRTREAADRGRQVQPGVPALEEAFRRRGAGGVVRSVQPLRGPRRELPELVGEAGQVDVAQVQERPHLPTRHGDGLLTTHIILHGEVARRGLRGPVDQSGCGITGQFEALGGPDRHTACGPGLDLDVDQVGKLVDQAGLDVFRAGRIAVADGGAADVHVQARDLRQDVVDVLGRGQRPGIGGGDHLPELGVDPGGLVEEVLDRRHRLRLENAGSRVLGCGVEGAPDPVQGREVARVRGRVPEQALGVVEGARRQAPAAGGGGSGEAGRDEELVDDAANAADLGAGPGPADDPVALVDCLPDVAGRVDVGDVVGRRPQARLGRDQSGGSVVQYGSQRHGNNPPESATLAQSRRFLPGSLCSACARPPKKSFHFNAATSEPALRCPARRKSWATAPRPGGVVLQGGRTRPYRSDRARQKPPQRRRAQGTEFGFKCFFSVT